ncbi:MAG: hypothetical protein KGJ59_06775 [Bacteroidota bacterium]|nr:hypothetical protein [Bacteroidota bacterium]
MIKSVVTFFVLLFLGYSGASAQYLSTRIITEKGVYLFGPSLVEADTLPLEQGEALDDFSYYGNKIAVFARSRGLTCEYVSERTIKIRFASKKFYTVNRDSVEFGTIFTDGTNEPLVLKYVVTDTELEEKCKEYFKLK